MSDFSCNVVRLTVEPHPDADRLEIARVGGYMSVVPKGQFKTGDLAAYLPEASIVPQALLEEMGLVNKLAGNQKNRIKAISLRGVLSQGICYKARTGWLEGQDVTEELGITKYIPPIPSEMSGCVAPVGGKYCIPYKINNWKMYPDWFQDGEIVFITEKIHGTWCQICVRPKDDPHPQLGRLVVASKGLANQGIAFDPKKPENENNLYLRAAKLLKIEEKIDKWFEQSSYSPAPLYILGEIYGSGVQDLSYGANARFSDSFGFRAFDIHWMDQTEKDSGFLSPLNFRLLAEDIGIETVPQLYIGRYSKEIVEEYTDGKETISGNELHTREGIIIRPLMERKSRQGKRVILKNKSEDYLLRRGGTEYA